MESQTLFKGKLTMPKKQTSSRVSTLASNVLAGRVKPTPKQTKALAASALGQDETRGQKRPTKNPKK